MALMLGASTAADAQSISGSVWENGTTTSVPAMGSSIYGTTPTVTFTATNNSVTGLLDFYSGSDASLNGFLTHGPEAPTATPLPITPAQVTPAMASTTTCSSSRDQPPSPTETTTSLTMTA
jgi:hypothetical protein